MVLQSYVSGLSVLNKFLMMLLIWFLSTSMVNALEREDVFSNQANGSQITTNQINTIPASDVAISKVADNSSQKSYNISQKSNKVVNDSMSMLAQNSAFHDRYSV
jgi:hypothetical protein